MTTIIGWIKDFLFSLFGNFWEQITTWAMKLLIGPVAFFLFGPLFKLSGYIAGFILGQIKPYMNDVGLTANGLMGWFISVLRLQECVSSLMTFLILGFMMNLIKKVF